MGRKKILKGMLKLNLFKKEVYFYYQGGEKKFEDLASFLFYDFGRPLSILVKEEELGVIKNYIEEKNPNDDYFCRPIKIFKEKEIGFSLSNKDKWYEVCDSRTKKMTRKYYPYKTFYSMKYKIGSDDLDISKVIEMWENDTNKWQSGYTSKLRKELNLSEPICRQTIINPPSMSPIIHTHIGKTFYNVKCFDITSAYPYLLTQPLPHFVKTITKEEFLKKGYEPGYTYYTGVEVFNIKAKTSFLPLTLIGDENKTGIKGGQGENINNIGTRLISADRVIIYGFFPELDNLLQFYSYTGIRRAEYVQVFKLEIDQKLRKYILEKFELKQSKKRAHLNYDAEKILLNRIYGFLITKFNTTPAHYGQYIVLKEKLRIAWLIKEIGLEDIVQSHTDSIKFVGNHQDVIDRYNSTIEFDELGKLSNEGILKKCYYFKEIVAKYEEEDGVLKFKHGGIHELGMREIEKMKFEEVTSNTTYNLIIGFCYSNTYGFCPCYVKAKIKENISEAFDEAALENKREIYILTE